MKFKAGISGNPGGRPSVAKACKAAGFDPDDLRKELIETLVAGMRKARKGSRYHLFCVDRLDLRLNGPVREVVHVDERPELTDEQYAAECAEIAREHIAALTEEEKLKLLTDTAPSPTIQ